MSINAYERSFVGISGYITGGNTMYIRILFTDGTEDVYHAFGIEQHDGMIDIYHQKTINGKLRDVWTTFSADIVKAYRIEPIKR